MSVKLEASHGSTAALTDGLGAAVNTYSYLPFGGELAWTETVTNAFQFVGQWGVMYGGNGLEFMRARYYVSELGRFAQADPVGVSGGVNLQEYVGNSPIGFIDPLGLRYQTPWWLELIYDLTYPSDLNPSMGQQFVWGKEKTKLGYDVWYHNYHTGNRSPGGERKPKVPNPAPESPAPFPRPEFPAPFRDPFEPQLPKGNQGNFPGGYWPPNTPPPAVPATPSNNTQSNPVRSYDPNDKLGPAGYGDDGYIAMDEDQSMAMPYTIRFENQADATAPAQWIRITDTFDEDLDLTTFELTEFMLGGEIFAIPAGLDSYEAQLERTIEGNELVIDVEITLDRPARTLSASFMALDPRTGWMPENPLVGLLYPNDEFGRGDGSISYVVDTVAGLPSGRRIENEARIYFDFNDPIDTPLVVNTIDAGSPTSHVLPLPPATTETEFLVEWTGEDDPGGSGIASYDVVYRVDDGSDLLWLNDTTDTSATFTGEVGHTYAFYSITTDNVGHKEAPPAAPDTVIYVNVSPTAEAGGSYAVSEGGTVQLDGTGSSDPDQAAGTLAYEWDFDGDGLFSETGPDATQGDELGPTPTFSAVGLDGHPGR